MASTYTPIATYTVSGTSTKDVTFSSIPSTYTDLVLVCGYARSSAGNNISMRFNSDTGTNYSETFMETNGTSIFKSRNSNDSSMRIAAIDGGTSTGQATLIINVQNYSNTTTYKTAISRYSEANGYVGSAVGLWRNTAAINSIVIGLSSTVTWTDGSVLTLYGITAA